MADELISRQALLKDVEETVVFSARPDKPSAEIRGANKILDRIKAAPSVDAVVLPCKVGDTVFYIASCVTAENFGEKYVSFSKVIKMSVDNEYVILANHNLFTFTDIYLTREETEKALEGREDNATD